MKAAVLFIRTVEASAPPVWTKIAELAKVDVNTIEDRMKAGSFAIDNLYDHYPAQFEIKRQY